MGPELVVVSVGPGGGLRVTGFSQAYFDSKLIKAPRKIVYKLNCITFTV